ncbi:XRE family transcriptional regulator [Streptomyces globosus]|uniref:XRE family transcriptional regulator n=1 Tax=Streptomyces globosus TaxID=68209 RepID=A0A344U3G5_9ACTN|nr:helix-turn-helix transcriptional regulator [Streptomyces globosus]AXE25436.1 XRE family transcriptional regulator [Streptomyces globosus]
MTEDLGTLLRTLRDRAGLTQEQVAERSGVSVRTIRRLESGGSTNHRMGTVNLLADALGLEEADRLRVAAALTGSSAATPVPAAGLQGHKPPDSPPAAFQGRTAPDPVPAAGLQGQGPPSPASAPPPRPPVAGVLAEAARELATEVRRRWRREEAQRRVHDPFPLPVRWQSAPAVLTDRAENIQRLGPGGTPREMDLGGDLRSLADVYLRIPSGRLVILGRAGSGKSILTIRLLLDLLESPAPHPRVPVIFSIGSWDPSTTALRDWLISRLLRDHPHLARRRSGVATLAAVLVDADLILPVLDGFDEIAEGLRRDALDALNATTTPLVLTSRRAEYAEAVRAAHAPLVWAGGIELTDLTLDDLADYLPRTTRGVPTETGTGQSPDAPGSPWDAVLTELRTGRGPAHKNLAAVLTTPLMVVLARTLYSETPDRDPAELLDTSRFPSAKSLDEHLLAGFVPAVYRRRAPERDAAGFQPRAPYADAARAERRLGFLAHHLVRLDRERQDLAWWQLGDSLSRATRTLAVVVASVVSITLAVWLVGLLLASLPLDELLLQGCLMGPAAGLAFGAVYALADRAGGGTAFAPTRIRLTLRVAHESLGRRSLRTFAVRFGHGLIGGAVMGVGCACALSLGRALAAGTSVVDPRIIEGTLINMLVLGLIFGSAAGLVFGLMAVLEVPVDVTAAATPLSLLASNRATAGRQFLILATAFTLAIAFGGYLIVHLLQGTMGPLNWAVRDSLFIGAVGGLGGAASYVLAFTAWGQWIVLARVWLPLAGRLPWDPAAFLDDAYRRGVLRQTGAVYQFRHVRLQHHLGRSFRDRHRDFAPATFTPPSTVDR